MALEQKLYELLLEPVKALGFHIVRIRYLSKGGKDALYTLEILIERLDRSNISVADCRSASYHISALLDVENVINSAYNLEVSSPGVERPLVRLEDFERFLNYVIRTKLHEVVEGKKKWQGSINAVEGQDIILLTEDKSFLRINFANIKEASLVLTEELFRKILK